MILFDLFFQAEKTLKETENKLAELNGKLKEAEEKLKEANEKVGVFVDYHYPLTNFFLVSTRLSTFNNIETILSPSLFAYIFFLFAVRN